jgi:predicted aminopeptidase
MLRAHAFASGRLFSASPLGGLSRRLALCWLCLLPWLLAGCAQTTGPGYYWQSLRGHFALMGAARPVNDWLSNADTPPALRERLLLAQRARDFAVTALHLPDNHSYRRYADLQRGAAIWNVVAAPVDSLTLHTWCFPVAGCVGYRGYFAEADARAMAAQLQQQGLEVSVYGVPAYSTLGYLDWLGGDPLLSTFVQWPEAEFVRLLFHELAHQVVYAKNDTMFNESFATAVERLGGAQWLATQASAPVRAAFATSEQRRSVFRALTSATRKRLEQIYAQKDLEVLSTQELLAMKSEAMQDFHRHYAGLRAQWLAAPNAPRQELLTSYDRWVARANNASFGAQAAYDGWVPAFEALFEREQGDWRRFYDAVQQLADQPADQRHAALCALAPIASEEKPCVQHPH